VRERERERRREDVNDGDSWRDHAAADLLDWFIGEGRLQMGLVDYDLLGHEERVPTLTSPDLRIVLSL
jgi:hypothetical protein